ncbi:MAG: outer membrane lipoprotein-sorting protein [bacterium]|nr:outer membrane lipoprotein-sorting protein [bacterium]
MKPIVLVIATVTLMFSVTFAAFSQDAPSADEIVAKANHAAYYQGKSGRADVKMTITDSQNRTREREFTILRKNMDEKDQEQRFFVYFNSPADVRKMVFMVWKHIGQDDDRWLYLPDLDLVKRIAASDKRTSFVGSTFFYEDVSGRNPALDTHELVETTDVYYVLKSTPKDAKGVEFAYYKTWIHKETFIPVQTMYYDESGKEYRKYTALAVEPVDGIQTVVKGQMEDLRSGTTTVNEYANVKYNLDFPDDIFSERYLRKPPREYLR